MDKAKELQREYGISLSHVIADEDGVGGGVVDFLYCKGFVNGSKPANNENFNNLKSQCGYYMANKIVKREVGEVVTSSLVVEMTSEEMEQVKQKDIDKALGKDSTAENKTRWLSCFEPENIISILHNNSSIKCSFGESKANDQGFWKYNAKIPITIEYEGWFGKKYTQNQDIQIIDSESFTGYQWG